MTIFTVKRYARFFKWQIAYIPHRSRIVILAILVGMIVGLTIGYTLFVALMLISAISYFVKLKWDSSPG